MKPHFDPAAALAHLRAADPRLAVVFDLARPCDLAPRRLGSLFEVLLRAIVYQQLNGKDHGVTTPPVPAFADSGVGKKSRTCHQTPAARHYR